MNKDEQQAIIDYAEAVAKKLEDMAQVLHNQSADIIAQGNEINDLNILVRQLEQDLRYLECKIVS